MRLGVCRGIDALDDVAGAGFDYIEPPIRDIAPPVTAGEMEEIRDAVEASPVKPEAFNCFIPGNLKVTGPEADTEALKDYVEVVLQRAAALGTSVVVFGSGGARGVPEGYPWDAAMRQIERFLTAINPIAAANDITVVIEPLCVRGCNIINRVAEGYALADKLGLSHVKLLADLYHVGQNGDEPYEDIAASSGLISHVHIAHPITRKCPRPGDGTDYAPFLRAVSHAGYDGRMSLECSWDDFGSEAPLSLRYLRR